MVEVANLCDATVNDEREPIMVHVVVDLWPFCQLPFVSVDRDGLCFVLFHRQDQTTPDRIVQQNSQTVFIHALKRSARTVQAFVQQFY
jgi:hypothetical protein